MTLLAFNLPMGGYMHPGITLSILQLDDCGTLPEAVSTHKVLSINLKNHQMRSTKEAN
jgi:hypothetical protein